MSKGSSATWEMLAAGVAALFCVHIRSIIISPDTRTTGIRECRTQRLKTVLVVAGSAADTAFGRGSVTTKTGKQRISEPTQRETNRQFKTDDKREAGAARPVQKRLPAQCADAADPEFASGGGVFPRTQLAGQRANESQRIAATKQQQV